MHKSKVIYRKLLETDSLFLKNVLAGIGKNKERNILSIAIPTAYLQKPEQIPQFCELKLKKGLNWTNLVYKFCVVYKRSRYLSEVFEMLFKCNCCFRNYAQCINVSRNTDSTRCHAHKYDSCFGYGDINLTFQSSELFAFLNFEVLHVKSKI